MEQDPARGFRVCASKGMLREGFGAVSCDRHGVSIQYLREAGIASAPRVAVKNPRQHVSSASALLRRMRTFLAPLLQETHSLSYFL